jgi:imidazolonepropionase-like amidohydrolase
VIAEPLWQEQMPGSELTSCRPAGTVCLKRLGLPALLLVGISALMGSTIAIAAVEDQTDKPDTSPPARIAIVGATLINPAKSQVLENSIVTIEGNRIISVAQAATNNVPANTRVIDAHGKWLLPGYVDAHVHFFQSGGLYTRPDALDLRTIRPYTEEVASIKRDLADTFRRYLRNGVTSVVDVGGPFWNFAVRKQANGNPLAPRVAVAGPLISSIADDPLDLGDPPIVKVTTPDEGRAMVRKQAAEKPDLIKVWYIVDENSSAEAFRPIVRAVIEESHQLHLRVAVHATELETARAAVEEGADVLVHSVVDRDVDDRFVQLLKQKATILIPTIVVFERYSRCFAQQLHLLPVELETGNPTIVGSLFDLRHLPAEQIPERVKKAMANPNYVASRRKLSVEPALRNLKTLEDAGVTIAAGTDAGNIGTLHGPSIFREFELMAEAGLTPMQILTAATTNGGKVFARDSQIGAIDPGMSADLVILRANPLADIHNASEIETVIKDGIEHQIGDLLPETPVDVVQRQVNAYNARSMEAFTAAYSPDAKVYQYPDQLLATGRDEIRKKYEHLFSETPALHVQILQRLSAGQTVIDQERVTGAQKIYEGFAIYEVADRAIRNVTLIPTN